MLFNFGLFPLSELITEIGMFEVENRWPVSWYHLTDGWYWIDVGETHLFRYTRESQATFQPLRPANGLYVDYHVAAFWRDLLERLPAMLEPIPAVLAERLSSITEWNDWVEMRQNWWNAQVDDEEDEDEAVDISYEAVEFELAATQWWYERSIDTSYLVAGPNIWFWNDGTNMHIGWDNRGRLLNDVPAWEAQVGQIAVPKADFMKDLLAFEHRFMEAMTERMEASRNYRSDPPFAGDFVSLQDAHHQYAVLLRNALRNTERREVTNWQRVLASIAAYPPADE